MTESNSKDAPSGDALKVSLEVEIPSDVRYIERVVDLVRGPCADLEFGARHLALNVPVALTEALSNAILRGNREDPHKMVRVRAEVDHQALVVEVRDEGRAFDFDACCADPTTPEQLVREDGRGLFLMRKLMDRVERLPNARGGNIVRLTLRRERSTAA
jgi:serine/threonine-protein kinase RsbW